jgi:2-methylcitrate dehydratase
VTYGPITAALGAAKVWRQPATKMTHAVNLAAVANIALRQTRVGEVSMWKACAFSNAARNGVMAATLARSGMTGPAPIFEGEKGFMKLVSGPLTLGGLGGERDGDRRVPFKILDTYIKHYPVEYHAQTAVEAALLVRDEIVTNEGPKALQTIAQVTIGSYDVAIEIIGRDPEKWRPATRETADHSFPYCVAVALLDGTVTLDSFAEKRIKHPAVHRLMERVKVVPDPEYVGRYPVSLPTRITVKTASGKEYTKERPYPLGHPREAMSDREVEEKCAALAEQHIGASRLRKLLDAVWRLDTLSDIGALTTLMRVRR